MCRSRAPETDKSGDFSPAKAETYYEPAAPPLNFDRSAWEDRVRKYTAPFQRYGNIYSAQAQITVYESFYSSTIDGLPSDAEVLQKVDKMTKSLMALKSAPVMEPYVGPAIMSPRSTGVIFHEIFGHRIEGQRENVRIRRRRSATRWGNKCCRNSFQSIPIRR